MMIPESEPAGATVTCRHARHRQLPAATLFADLLAARWRWSIAMALLSGAAIYAFWWIPRLIRPWNDFAFVYAAGRTWLAGVSPYHFDHWNLEWAAIRPVETHVAQPMPFMYPPHWGPIAVLLAAFPWPVATRIWDAVNVLAYFGACAFSLTLLRGEVRELVRKPAVWVFLAFGTLNPALRYSIFQSQMTLLPTLGVVGAFWGWHERKTVWLVVFGFVASLKPQLGLLPLLYLFLNGGHVGLLWAGAAAVGIGFLSMLPTHLELLPEHVAHSLALHMQLDFNQPKEFFNVPALAAGHLSGHAFMMTGPILAVIIVAAITWMRRRHMAPAVLHDPMWQLSLVATLTGALMPVHGYDLVIYTPLAFLAYRLRSTWMGLLLVAFIVCTGRPGVFADYLHLPVTAPVLTGTFAVAVAALACRYRSGDAAMRGARHGDAGPNALERSLARPEGGARAAGFPLAREKALMSPIG